MQNHWRKLYSLLPESLEKKLYSNYFLKEHKKWQSNASPFPPSHLSKQNALKKISEKYKINILVETGTYLGDMLFALQDKFDYLYSIELSDLFYSKAVKRFRDNKKIKLYQGDSGIVLKQIVDKLNEPALFWLDGHYSGGSTAKGEKDCPVYEELNEIFKSEMPHFIMIDDARLFIGKEDYPTIEELKSYVFTKRPSYTFEIENDGIQIYSKNM